MNAYKCDDIRNVCLLGHGGAGKTSLTEAMLFLGGGCDRLGKVTEGNTTSDYDSEEVNRKISVYTTVNPLEWKNKKINVFDTPGFFDFEGEVHQALRVAGGSLIVVAAKNGVQVGTEFAWKYTEKRKIPKIIFVSKMEEENADYNKVLNDLRDHFGKSICPFYFPIIEDDKFKGYVNVIKMEARKFENGLVVDVPDIPENMMDELMNARQMIMESVAESSEELMEKYFAGEEFTTEEIQKAIRAGVADLSITPVLCGSAFTSASIRKLLDAVIEYLPAPNEIGSQTATNPDTDDVVEIECKETEPMSAFVFKTIADPFVGKLSFVKVYSGVLKADSNIYNSNEGITEKIGKIYYMRGKKQIETKEIVNGDIGAIPKLSKTKTGDTLCDPSKKVMLEGINYPKPVLTMAIKPKAKGDEEKISNGIARIKEEDKTVSLTNNHETHQTLLSGMGETHLDVVVSKLINKFKVEVELENPKTAYRETIRKKTTVEGKYKKQSGGHGQYGHVKIEFEPGESAELTFEEKIFGGSVPKNFFPAVEKGLQDSCKNGVLAGYPVVNLKATLIDGSYHAVDSSEMAFKSAASLAFKNGLPDASPVLLEPIDILKIQVPDKYTGDVMGDINKRRGRVLGMEPIGEKMQEITAEVPSAELIKYATSLRSMTRSRGKFTQEFIRYEETPSNVAEQIIKEAKEKMAE